MIHPFRQLGGRHAKRLDVSPADTTPGAVSAALPAPDCACGNPGDLIVDGRTRCTSCFLADITPWRRRRRI